MFGYPQYPQQYPQYSQYPQPDYLDQLNRLKQQQAPPQQMQQQSNPDERIWVQGQGAAESIARAIALANAIGRGVFSSTKFFCPPVGQSSTDFL